MEEPTVQYNLPSNRKGWDIFSNKFSIFSKKIVWISFLIVAFNVKRIPSSYQLHASRFPYSSVWFYSLEFNKIYPFLLTKKPRCSHQIQIFLENLMNNSRLVITLFQEYNIDNKVPTKPIFCCSKFYNGLLQSRSCRYSYFEQELRRAPYKRLLVILNTDMLEVFLDSLAERGVYNNVRLRIVGFTSQQVDHLQTRFPQLSLEMNDTSNLTFRMIESISLRIQEMQMTR